MYFVSTCMCYHQFPITGWIYHLLTLCRYSANAENHNFIRALIKHIVYILFLGLGYIPIWRDIPDF